MIPTDVCELISVSVYISLCVCEYICVCICIYISCLIFQKNQNSLILEGISQHERLSTRSPRIDQDGKYRKRNKYTPKVHCFFSVKL